LVPGSTSDLDIRAGVEPAFSVRNPVEMEWELAPELMLVEKGHLNLFKNILHLFPIFYVFQIC